MTRNVKISADITRDAKKALDEYSKKHDRSRGWLLNRMILKFCDVSTSEAKEEHVLVKSNNRKVKKFTPPTVEEVAQYCNERCNNVDAQTFVDHYSSNGWMRGKNKIKNWKACVHTWEKNSKSKPAENNQFSKTTAKNIDTLGEWINE